MVDPDSDRVSRALPYSGTASWRPMHVAYGDFTLFVRPSQTVPLYIDFFSTPRVIPMRPYNPTCVVWALPISLAATFGISGGSLPFLISFPGLLRWFSSPSVASVSYFIQIFGYWDHSQWVTPFGYPGITGYVLLPLAFRSLSRPSSPRSSKASTIHLYSLDHIIVSSLPTRPEVSLKSQAPLLSSIAEQAYHGALSSVKILNFFFKPHPFRYA